MPEREAMNHLGHKSRAVHAAYAGVAEVAVMPLEFYEAQRQEKVIQFQQARHLPTVSGNDNQTLEKHG